MLKLFGRVLERLQIEPKSGLAWAMVELEDFVQSRSESKYLVSVLERLRLHYSEARCLLLLHKPTATSFSGVLYAKNSSILEKLSTALSGSICGEYFFFESKREFSNDFIATLERALQEV
jgi:hypothetical protein